MGLRDQLRSTLNAQLQVASARECNRETSTLPAFAEAMPPPYGNLTERRLAADLVAAVRLACRARGDSMTQVNALIEDCAGQPKALQLDLLDHFRAQAENAALALDRDRTAT